MTRIVQVSGAYLSSLISEQQLLKERKKLILSERESGYTCDSKVECGQLSITIVNELGSLGRRILELDKAIAHSRGYVLRPPEDCKVLRPGLRAHLRLAYDNGEVIPDAPIHVIDVGVHAEFCPSSLVPVCGEHCRQISKFIGKDCGFCAVAPDFYGALHNRKLVLVEPTPDFSIAA